MFERFDFSNAHKLYNPYSYDPMPPYEELKKLLTEDMFRVSYEIDGDCYTIGVGWNLDKYDEDGEQGFYKIVLFKNSNREEPLQCRWTWRYAVLEEYMADFLEYLLGRSDKVRQLSVFIVQHEQIIDEDSETYRVIGIYSTKDRADAAVERAKLLPGFREQPENFCISEYVLNEDHWTTGFVTVYY